MEKRWREIVENGSSPTKVEKNLLMEGASSDPWIVPRAAHRCSVHGSSTWHSRLWWQFSGYRTTYWTSYDLANVLRRVKGIKDFYRNEEILNIVRVIQPRINLVGCSTDRQLIYFLPPWHFLRSYRPTSLWKINLHGSKMNYGSNQIVKLWKLKQNGETKKIINLKYKIEKIVKSGKERRAPIWS